MARSTTKLSPTLAAALDYASRGWLVFPLETPVPLWSAERGRVIKGELYCSCWRGQNGEICKDNGKHPRSDDALLPHGKNSASADEDLIRKWWAEWPNTNLAICGGMQSGLVIVDIDPRHGGDTLLLELFAEHGEFPETLRATTGSGGTHYYFQHPGKCPLSGGSNKLGVGIDVKADDGYVVAPPSLHFSGRHYSWDNPGAPIAPLPAWVLEKLEEKKPRAAGTGNRKYTESDPALILDQCAWLRHCKEDAAHLPEGEWYHMLSILARCQGGAELAHAWSSPYPNYNREETDAKLAHALTASGPVLCSTINHPTYCQSCAHRARNTSPAVLGGGRQIVCRNFSAEQKLDEKSGEMKTVHMRRALPDIIRDLLDDTGGWPKCVSESFFVIDQHRREIRYLKNQDAVFGWLESVMPVQWKKGSDCHGIPFCGPGPFYEELAARCERFQSVEILPHEPRHPEFYYYWDSPVDYNPVGAKHLRNLLEFFTNTETNADRALLMAMLLTPAWGSEFNHTPAFAIEATDVGCGKTTIADVVSIIYGGKFDLKCGQKAQDDLVARLLTPSARQKRIILYDNAKGELGGQFIESLITDTQIGGKEMYKGESSRPNTLVLIVTGNGLRLNSDMARRFFVIRLIKPKRDPSWDSRVKSYARQYRQEILADIVWVLQQAPGKTTAEDSWMEFVHEILPRCTDYATPEEVMRVTMVRRVSRNEDLDQADMILEELRAAYGTELKKSPGWQFLTNVQVAGLVREAIGTKALTTNAAKAILRRHLEAGHFNGNVRDGYKLDGRRGITVFCPMVDVGALECLSDLSPAENVPQQGGTGR